MVALISVPAAFAMLVTGGAVATATADEPANVTSVQAANGPTSVDDLRDLVNQLAEAGEVARPQRLLFLLELADTYWEWLGCSAGRFELSLEQFKRYAQDPFIVPSESAQDQLVIAADQLLFNLCGTT